MQKIRNLFCFVAGSMGLFSCAVFQKSSTDLNKTTWIHGSQNCKENSDPPIQVVQFNPNTWILRQNKCINYEAPFLFLFVGRSKALLMDTGATEGETQFPLFSTVQKLLAEWQQQHHANPDLIVAHTHAHGDHTAGDSQFRNKTHVTIVEKDVDAVKAFFNFKNWPSQAAEIELGNRKIELIPIPGHDAASLALYDPETRILLSGDSFYPGRLYIRDWPAYKQSMQRLMNFATAHKVSYILGNHIEMTRTPGKDYPVGTTFQPDEPPLPLQTKDLQELNSALQRMGETPGREVLSRFIIYPK